MKKFLPFLILLTAAFLPSAFAQNISNEGTDFWTVFPTHDPSMGDLATMNVNVTSRNNSEVTVTCGNYAETRKIPANTVVTFLVDRNQSYIDYLEGNSLLTNRGIHIKVTQGMPKVVAYSHVFASARSAATLILPWESLGQKYYSMNYTQTPTGQSQNFLVLVAAENNTDLILHQKSGDTIHINLRKAGDVFEYISTSKEDLTGTFVEVNSATSFCKRFAAFSGATSITIGPCNRSSDPLLQQLYAVNSWGKNYGLVPFKDRTYIFRVLAQEDNTDVKVNGTIVTTLAKGGLFESGITYANALISANKLISVAQYSLTQACSSLTGQLIQGDPEMVLLNPVEFNIKNVTVFSSNNKDIREKYVNVFIKTTKTHTFRLNGVTPPVSWTPMKGDSTYSFAQLQVTDESLTLTADEGFNAIAYGFGEAESYAYSAGTNLYSTSTLSLLNKSSGLVSTSAACLGQETQLNLTLPYRLTKITWDYDDGSPRVTETNLGQPVESIDNVGAKLYTYTSPVGKIFTNPGVKKIIAIAVLLPDDTPPCFDGTDLEFNFQIEVVPIGVANFDIPDICAGTPIQFFDKSSISGSTIAEWRWEFDGMPKTEQNPWHTFTKGKHIVRLSVANASGCWSDLYIKEVVVEKEFPKLAFATLKPICIDAGPIQLVVIERLGLSAAKTTFAGDGISLSGVFDPKVAGVGVHKIMYTFISKDGCTDSVSQDIEVYATTVIDAPKTVYILAGGERMMPVGLESPNSTYNYKYKWTPAIGLSDYTILSPITFPEKDTEYTLTVSIDGFCDVSKKVFVKVLDEPRPANTFSPNGDNINDIWNIESLDSYPNSEISIFNRNGQKVFSSIGYKMPFDGNYHGNPLPVGIYYYVIDPKNGRGKITGSLTLIR